MYKFKIKLLYNEEKPFWSKTDFLNFKVTLPLAKWDMVGSLLVSNGFICSDYPSVDIQFVTFLLLSNIRELSTGAKTRKFW